MKPLDPVFWKTIVFTLVAVLGATVGETLLSVGMRRIGEAPALADWRAMIVFYLKAFASPYVLIGIVCLALYFFTFLQLVSWADLSLVLPMTALTFVLATILARFWIGETVTATRWLGTFIIVVGVAIVASTGTHDVQSGPAAPAPTTSSSPPASS